MTSKTHPERSRRRHRLGIAVVLLASLSGLGAVALPLGSTSAHAVGPPGTPGVKRCPTSLSIGTPVLASGTNGALQLTASGCGAQPGSGLLVEVIDPSNGDPGTTVVGVAPAVADSGGGYSVTLPLPANYALLAPGTVGGDWLEVAAIQPATPPTTGCSVWCTAGSSSKWVFVNVGEAMPASGGGSAGTVDPCLVDPAKCFPGPGGGFF
jgi:hypothetical protein